MNGFWFCIIYIISTMMLSTLIFTIGDFFHNKFLHSKLWDIGFYIRNLNFETYTFTYKNKEFCIEYKDDKDEYFECVELFINNECALKIFILEHTFRKSRRFDYNTKRNDVEIRKIIRAAHKSLKKDYYKKLSDGYGTSSNSYFK